MPDALTERLRKEYQDRAISLSSPTTLPAEQPPTRQQKLSDIRQSFETGEYPEWYQPSEGEHETSSNMLNALGVGLWQGVDTFALGIPNYLLKAGGIDMEDHLDYEDPAAKWTGAIGGFAGFVGGAPMKIIGKGAQKLGMKIVGSRMLKKTGHETADEVMKIARKKGAEHGLSRSARQKVLKGYQNIVRESQINPNLWGKQFGIKVGKYVDQIVRGAGKDGILSIEQASAVTRMFGEANLYSRPIQDFIGVMAARAGKPTRFNRWIGHAANDILMFSAIDTVMEGVRFMGERATGEGGYDFNFTAPLWGAVNGASFSLLGWLAPRGKAAVWKRDFMAGARSAFSKNPYKNKSSDHMLASAKFWGEQLENIGSKVDKTGKVIKGPSTVLIRDKSFDLKSKYLGRDLETAFGKDGIKHLTDYLHVERKKFGKGLMKWATTQEASNFATNWRRMMMGGLLFNTHTFFDMYYNDVEADVNDILPHFLIGAWLQRRSNPAKFDLKSKKMNEFRQNLTILGVSPEQFSRVPTFEGTDIRVNNIFNDSKFKSLENALRDEGIITENLEISETGIPEGESSVALKENPIFLDIWNHAKGRDVFRKSLDHISQTQADRIVKKALKIDPRMKDGKDRKILFGESILSTTEAFESNFSQIIDFMSSSDVDAISGIESKPEQGRTVRTPRHISVTNLMGKADRGELEWLKDRETGDVLSGDAAKKELSRFSESMNAVLESSIILGTSKLTKTEKKDRNLGEDHEGYVQKVYEKIIQVEKDINSTYPNKSLNANKFSFGADMDDYLTIVAQNHSIRVAENTIAIFKEGFGDRDKLVSKLVDAGILFNPGRIGAAKIIDDARKIDIRTKKTDEDAESDISDARRFLDRVLSLQSIVGSELYEGHEIDINQKPKVSIQQVNELKSFLKKHGLDIGEMNDYMASQIIDYALRDKIKNTDLTMHQIEALFNFTEYGLSRFETKSEGKAGGFRVKTINEKISGMDENGYKFQEIKDYNIFIRKAVKDSNGLVTIEGERTFKDAEDILSLKQAIPSQSEVSGNARAQIQEFLLQVSASKYNYTDFAYQMEQFNNADPRNASRLVKWLRQTGVLKVGDSAKYLDVDVDVLNTELKELKQKVFQNISDRMNGYGYSPQYARRLYEQYEQNARDKFMEDVDESDYTPNITIEQFYRRYRIDGTDESNVAMEKLRLSFEELIYHSKDDRLLKMDVINDILDRVHIKSGGNYYSLSGMENTTRVYRTPEVVRDVIGLLVQQRAQERMNVIKWVDGSIKESYQMLQASKFSDFLQRGLQLPYYIVDPRASVYEMSADGRWINKIEVNVFGDTNNLSERNRAHIKSVKTNFERVMNQKVVVTEDNLSTIGVDGQVGVSIFRLFPNMEAIAIQNNHLSNVHDSFYEFVERFNRYPEMKQTIRDKMYKLRDSFLSETESSPNEYNEALKYLVAEQMLTGSDGTRLFRNFLNGKEPIAKLMARIKLFNTKKFVRPNRDWVLNVADIYQRIGEKDTSKDIRKILRKGGFDVVTWDDVGNANLKDEVNAFLTKLGIQDKWSYDDVIGNAHEKVSAFDSIAFVPRHTMRYSHAIIGHNPNSFTPLKPVISSGGTDSPLLLGKTLLVYSEHLEPFFSRNGADILLTRSGAKALNSTGSPEGVDTSLLNSSFSDLRDIATVSSGQMRRISIESLGLKADKDYASNTAKRSTADDNFANNDESSQLFKDYYDQPVQDGIAAITTIMQDPISIRKWILLESGADEGLVTSISESEGLSHFNNMVYFSSISKDADPMSYSEGIVKNKLYNMYINKLINNMRSVSNQSDGIGEDSSQRYGGQSILIQTNHRLAPTVVGKDHNMIVRGEVMLGAHEWDSPVKILSDRGLNVRFVYAGKEMTEAVRDSITGQELFGKSDWDTILRTAGEGGLTLGSLYEQVTQRAAAADMEGMTLGIVVRRNPRTRPNDMSILGLAGFLEKSYGNSMQINSFDVANVYEGDYDVDKADYWFANKDSFYSHVDRASKFFVQGIDPSDLILEKPIDFGTMSTGSLVERVNEIAADLDLYKSSIGSMQKLPRMLGFADKVGWSLPAENPMLRNFNENNPNTKLENPRVLLGGNKNQDWSIIMDYNNNDFFSRAALETQYIIDGKGTINKDISRNVDTVRNDFLFPRYAKGKSIAPGEARKEGSVFLNELRKDGHSRNRRVRIFRKIQFDKKTKTYYEVELSRLDKSILKEMLSEYGNLLNATGDSLFENTGAKRKVSYEDVFDASERFFLFNKDINSSLYYRLRNRFQDMEAEKRVRWRDDLTVGGKEFKDYFGVKSSTYKDKFGNKQKYFRPTTNLVNESAITNAREFFDGTRGAPIDRILQRVYMSDPFNRKQVRGVTGDIIGLMDSWYNELSSGVDNADATRATDVFVAEVAKAKLDFNKKVGLIGSLKRKVMQINSNEKVPYNIRRTSMEKLNKVINDVEQEIAGMIPKKYWKTKKIKDLSKINFVSVDQDNLKLGTIYYNTINSVKEILPGLNGDKGFGLKPSGLKALDQLQRARKLFYSNRTTIGDVLKYGDKTILTSELRSLLENFDSSLSTITEVENKLMLNAYSRHGNRFLYKFMEPTLNKYNIGIFEGKPVPVPFEKSERYDPASRYRRGIRFLTGIASGTIEAPSLGMQETARDALKYIQFAEAHWQRYFNRKVDMKRMYDEGIFGSSDNSDIYRILKPPEFNNDFRKMYSRFQGLRWNQGRDRIGHGRSLINDHLIDFYKQIMQAAGKTKEFESYLTQMSHVQSRMIDGEIIDPVEYLSIRSQMDREVMDIAQTVFTGGFMESSGNRKLVRNIRENPVYALMGGKEYFKGLAFETQAKRSIDRIKDIRDLSENLENIKNKVNLETIDYQQRLERLRSECPQ